MYAAIAKRVLTQSVNLALFSHLLQSIMATSLIAIVKTSTCAAIAAH